MKSCLSKGFKVFVVLFFWVVGVSAYAHADAPTSLAIATGSPNGVYHPLGTAVAKVLETAIPQSTVKPESTRGSVDNINLIVAGKAHIGFSQADTAWDGFKGYGQFTKPMSIRTIAVFYPEHLQLVTLRDSGISSVNDLRNKRVSTGPNGSGTEIWANRLLAATGLDPEKDINRTSLPIAESVAALKERKIDAFIWGGGVPTKAISDLALGQGNRLKLLDTAKAVPHMLRKFGPVYTDGEIPANTYVGQTISVKTADVWTLLLVRTDMDEKLVYEIVKALFEDKSTLISGHALARNLEISNQMRGGSPIPFHPGSKKYLAEQGVRILR